ncbi:heavy metal translocating P-type ATPase [Bifidobacterium pullorum subsp. gallinarum]|uniref:Heavy metal translocating P-type ATPase n=1 Tax=Bifidobacterium pullorum subsp. gallinarum TaxID=78344 RepID=A0A4P6DRB4_9BIFI|nr:heavy metal translocating P-type ATPase [Bifidobacterium pullorum]QAY32136.1 heavy metal translocating P-type ATPase [Bifidobacterium pullorum subsp. gallinarum]
MKIFIAVLHRVLNVCKLVPMLPIVIVSALPIALLWDFRPWDKPFWFVDPSIGQWIVIVLVAYTVIDTLRGMIDDIRHGHVGVDILAVVALLSTMAVGEYWASWVVVLMVFSGSAIEAYAEDKAKNNLTALMEAAPQIAHVADLPGVGSGAHAASGSDDDARTMSRIDRVMAADATEPDARTTGDAGADIAHAPYRTVPVDQVRLGDVLIVLPGETVPVDGELLSGSATLDLSNINGEPVPREVFAGARVMSGAINGSATLTMRATELARDSQYQRIIELVSSAQESRATVVKTADLMAVPFTVISFVIACSAWIVSADPTRFAQVLVLATPCPLLIAAPVAYIAGTGRLAKAGIIIKTQEVLENLGRVSHVFFDKTGTLTVKKPQVVRVEIAGAESSDTVPAAAEGASAPARSGRRPYAGLDADHILMYAGVVESYSVHILAKGITTGGTAVMDRLKQRAANGETLATEDEWLVDARSYPVVRGVTEDAGNGVSGEVNGHRIRVGRFAFVTATEDGTAAAQTAATPDVAGRGAADAGGFRATVDAARRRQEAKASALAARKLTVAQMFGELAPDEMATYVAVDGELAARIVLKDVPRANAKESLDKLRGMGVERLTMLTGDKRASADIIASEVGINDVHAELFPEGKVQAIVDAKRENPKRQPWWDKLIARFVGESTTRSITMMVGDGVNDAPVLAAADIGMAITDGTSTAASESAQVVIMNDDIAAVPRAVAISRRTKRVMIQAVCLGLGLALVGMIAAAFNLIPVVIGALMQEAIDVVSILWALTALIDKD